MRLSYLHRLSMLLSSAVDLWLACHTQEQIADQVGIPQQTVADILPKLAELPESVKPAALHLADFDPPIYNVWKQQEKTNGASRVIDFFLAGVMPSLGHAG